MVDFDFLYKGLSGLARAHRASGMAGHLGAALAAGYFYGEEHHGLPDGVYSGIEQELQRVIHGEEAIWFNAKKAGISVAELFEPFPEEPPQRERISTIADALAVNIGKLRQSGHNVIFAALAIRCLHDHPEYATASIIDGIRKLIAGFNNAVPGRGYFGKQTGWLGGEKVVLADTENFPMYRDLPGMVSVVVDELIQRASVRKQGFGGLWHVINHAAALAELSRLGYAELARKGLAAHHHHVRLWRSLPDVASELGPVVKADDDPRTAEFWAGLLKRDDARLTHRIKTLYGFYTLTRFIEDESRRKEAEDKLLYLMA